MGITDRERKSKLSKLLGDTRRELSVKRGTDISWVALTNEIGLNSPVSMYQYNTGVRLPDGRNLILLARWFRQELDIDLYDFLAYDAGGVNDPRVDYLYDVLGEAKEEDIKLLMAALAKKKKRPDDGAAVLTK
jgi:hypothetical protein